MNPTILFTLTPAALPRKKAHVDSANFSPVNRAAVRPSPQADQRRAEIVRRVLIGKRTKEIAYEIGMSEAYVHTRTREAGFSLMRVTKAERDMIMQARRLAVPFPAAPVAQVPVELKHQHQPTRPGQREAVREGRA